MKKEFIIRFIFCFLFAVLSFNTLAQKYKYDISDYYTPDIVRNKLDLTFNTDGNSYTNKYRSNQTNYKPTNDSAYSTNLNGSLYSRFETYTNTRQLQSLLTLSLNLSGKVLSSDNSYSQLSPNEYNHLLDFNSYNHLSVNFTNRFYNSSNQFLSLGGSIGFNNNVYNTETKKDSILTLKSSNSFNAGVSPYVGIGVGRLESVEDARQAIYILDELSKKGVLTRKLSNKEFLKFAQKISGVKNKRFLDSRLHQMEEISSLDSFFVSNNLLNKSDASYFTTLYDMWQYGASFERKSGQVFEINFTPNANWSYSKRQTSLSIPDSTYWSKYNSKTYDMRLTFDYTYEKPFNLNWQHSAHVTLTGSISSNFRKNSNSTINTESLYNQNYSNVQLSGRYNLGYYPDTRTHLTAGISQNIYSWYSKSYEINTINSINGDNSLTSTTSLNFSAYHYLSPQLRISGSASLGYYYRHNTFYNPSYNGNYLSNRFEGEFSATLSYSFF